MRIRIDGEWAQSQVDRLRRALPRDAPRHLLSYDGRKRGDEFRIDTLFSILSRLRPPRGMVIDYVYAYHNGAGCPLPYLRREGTPPLQSEDELRAQDDGAADPGQVFDALACDRSPEGFFELVLFRTMAMQFYLHWHAKYMDESVIGNRRALASALAGSRSAPGSTARFRTDDPSPCVSAKGAGVHVHVLTSSTHSGLCRQSFHFRSAPPHRLQRERRMLLAESNGGPDY